MSASPVALPSMLQMVLGLYAFLLPLLLYVVWSTLTLWDLGRRPELATSRVWLWALAVFLLPFVGPLAYLGIGGDTVPRLVKLTAVLGGVVVYGLVLVAGRVAGGIS